MTLQLPETEAESSHAIMQIKERLFELLEDILDKELPIIQTEDHTYCKYCEFASICNR